MPSRLRRFAVRATAVALLAATAVLGLAEVNDLRGELAFARFRHLRRLAEMTEESGSRAELGSTVQNACAEAELVMLFARENPDALGAVTVTCLSWSASEMLDPMLRLRIGEKAVTAGALAVRAAPSDFELWLWLARAQASLGLGQQARVCLETAQRLAPPGKVLQILPAPA